MDIPDRKYEGICFHFTEAFRIVKITRPWRKLFRQVAEWEPNSVAYHYMKELRYTSATIYSVVDTYEQHKKLSPGYIKFATIVGGPLACVPIETRESWRQRHRLRYINFASQTDRQWLDNFIIENSEPEETLG